MTSELLLSISNIEEWKAELNKHLEGIKYDLDKYSDGLTCMKDVRQWMQ